VGGWKAGEREGAGGGQALATRGCCVLHNTAVYKADRVSGAGRMGWVRAWVGGEL